MKKGFTLIELLIVMVIVGALVTIALPKYRTAMEKGRATEAITNLSNYTAAINARYIMDDNSYTKYPQAKLAEFGKAGGMTQSRFFTAPTIHSVSAQQVVTKTTRSGSSNAYTIYFVSDGGNVTSRQCSGNERYCAAAGANISGGTYGWKFNM